MYTQVVKPKENKSRAVANSVAQKKSNVKSGIGFVDNRSDTVCRKKNKETINSRSYSMQFDNRPVNKEVKSNNLPIQRAVVPDALIGLENDAKYYQNVLDGWEPAHWRPARGKYTGDIPGANAWANDVQASAKRKLNEADALFNMEKEVVEEKNGLAWRSVMPSFGISDISDPDSAISVLGEEVAHNESKYVTGERTQVRVNANSALNQLLTGDRAHQLNSRKRDAYVEWESKCVGWQNFQNWIDTQNITASQWILNSVNVVWLNQLRNVPQGVTLNLTVVAEGVNLHWTYTAP